MIRAVFYTLFLRLWRDKGAMAMAFLLPGFIFAIFATIFDNAAGGDLDLRIIMAVDSPSMATQNLAAQIARDAPFQTQWAADPDTVFDDVRMGRYDAGIILRGDIADTQSAPIIIVTEPSRKIAGDVLRGQLRAFLSETRPDLLIRESLMFSGRATGPLTDKQQTRVNIVLIQAEGGALNVTDGPLGLITTHSARASGETGIIDDPSIAYYAGATIAMFLLFSAMHGAAISLEERGSGITDRLLLGPSGAMAMMTGKFFYLTAQGFVQAWVILIVAAIGFGVPVFDAVLLLAIISLIVSGACAALALLVSTIAKNTIQMNTLATFLVLLFSAIGGSMIPRFMMPTWLQTLGNFTPNAWAIEAYYASLARGSNILAVAPALAILCAITVIALISASVLSHRLMRF
ncbi:ABC transporter permease [Robiginitomaculum antarcticum]|uniref:ABC transporter permease n=1 Tax=Robiginitomaculum antarcticum TaxID=437507 RepID=UPI00037EE877|nr:ABC transporter permease [Robiginitomaculum antarcticum]